MSRLLPLLLILLVAACATPGVPVAPREAAEMQQAREDRILGFEHWALRGRIAVSDGRDGGSARVNWEADGGGYELWIYAPLAQGTWRLHGDEQGAVLEGSKGTFRDRDATALLARHLGWHLPVEAMRHWARGMRAPGEPARVEFDARGRPEVLEQAGWTVRFTDWAEYPQLVMPRRIEADSPPFSVKLVIQGWALQEATHGRAPAHSG